MLATLEVPGQTEAEHTGAPELIEVVSAVELLVLGAEFLLRIEEVAHAECRREVVAETLLDLRIDLVCGLNDGVTHRDAVVVVPREVDVELRREREG